MENTENKLHDEVVLTPEEEGVLAAVENTGASDSRFLPSFEKNQRVQNPGNYYESHYISLLNNFCRLYAFTLLVHDFRLA